MWGDVGVGGCRCGGDVGMCVGGCRCGGVYVCGGDVGMGGM